MIIFSSSFDCDSPGKYFCLWPSLGVPFIVVLSCSHFNSYTPLQYFCLLYSLQFIRLRLSGCNFVCGTP